jgi:prolyl-tRNA editing enzyme YbaK/EbsC (Cys-tRNA(Pro) deacylase)
VWPEAVEGIAAFLRESGVEGTLEELLPGAGPPAGQRLRADRFDTDQGSIVALVPADRTVDERKLAAAADRSSVRPGRPAVFPFADARVFVEHSVLSSEVVWLEAGSPTHVLGLSPALLISVTKARTADLLREGSSG